MHTKYLKELFYPSVNYQHHDNIFTHWIEISLDADSIILDLGAGSGSEWHYDLKKCCKRILGIDVNPSIKSNPNIDEAIVSDFLRNNFKTNSFDIVFANYVVEHIVNPNDFLVEVRKILKKDGVFYFRTLNKYHYAGVISRFTPHWFHIFYNCLLGREEYDILLTFYRMNSIKDIDGLAKKLNFKYEIKMFEGCPEYLMINPILFMLGIIYERIVNKFSIFKRFKGIIMCRIVF